ncbi:MAG TPA: VOC family protein [Ktedonobacteraceae bacterium]|nr:VOC family protein [Ktedonobacteraceae bacterium]
MPIQFQKLDYIIVYVSDMQRSVAFYRDILGLPMKFTSPGWTEFIVGSTTLALHGAGTAPSPAEQVALPPSGQAQLGFMVDDLQATYEALVAQDIHFSLPPKKQNSGVLLAVFHDPDGLGITIQQRQS